MLYRTEGFLQKNNNSLHEDLDLVLKGADDPFVKVLYAPAEPEPAKATDASGASSEPSLKGGDAKGKGKRGGGKARFSSVSGHFLGQLTSLTDTLASTTSHFVRCVNPNKTKTANSFAGGHVLHQLRCSGMMEALRLMHAGFPTRCQAFDRTDAHACSAHAPYACGLPHTVPSV